MRSVENYPGYTTVYYRNLLGLTIAVVILNYFAKGRLDIFPIVAGVWLVLSYVLIPLSTSVARFGIFNVILLVADSILDIVAMGEHLSNLWNKLPIAPWHWGHNGEAMLITYWVLLWGAAVPNRTLAMIHFIPNAAYSRRGVWLLVGVIALHVTFVEDVIYFALLGYPPFVTRPPLDYAYLPTFIFVRHWTAWKVWLDATFGTIVFILTVVATYFTEIRQRLGRSIDGNPVN
ncbi:hypothetical protein ACOJUR_04830 [Alicyclobacillus tolerans]|uniref:hypothetical protein n=1 Tax=Alicyclobacillus tolerans TaxID=90970 RepID=UPI003B77EDC1